MNVICSIDRLLTLNENQHERDKKRRVIEERMIRLICFSRPHSLEIGADCSMIDAMFGVQRNVTG